MAAVARDQMAAAADSCQPVAAAAILADRSCTARSAGAQQASAFHRSGSLFVQAQPFRQSSCPGASAGTVVALVADETQLAFQETVVVPDSEG